MVGEIGGAEDSFESIFNCIPDEQGGRIARHGFEYQDHIGAKFCLEMMQYPELSEVWFEHIDDIVAIRKINNIINVEMIQVKTDNPPHRWTLSYLAQRKNGKGSSIIEKSLMRAKFKERTHFRIVVSHEIVQDLSPLTSQLINCSRREPCPEIDEIVAKGEKYLDKISSLSGLTLRDWFYNLHIDKHEEAICTVQSCNVISFGRLLSEKKHRLVIDKCEELYLSLLAYVKRASIGQINKGSEDYKIKKRQLEDWLVIKIVNFDVGIGSEKMVQKMQDSNIPQDMIEGAKALREHFVSERLNPKYSDGIDFDHVEASVIATLQYQKAKLDSEEISDNGMAFHSRCLDALKELSESQEWGDDKPSLALLEGCMYNLTNRSIHRFKVAEP